jgi:DNA mismatch repair protein MutS
MTNDKSKQYLKFTKTIHEEYLILQKYYSELYSNDKTIVLMQIGSFHEAYSTKDEGYDLHRLSNILNIIVSKKNKKIKDISKKNPYMLGFPTVATPKFIKILIENGFHVIKIDQVTNPPNPKRAITGIYSPGTYIEEVFTSESNNIMSLYIEEIKQFNDKTVLLIGLSIIDLTVGKSIVHETYSTIGDDKYSLDECIKFISNFNPSEIIINYKKLITTTISDLVTYLELNNKECLIYELKNKEIQNITYQNNYLKKIFKLDTYLSIIEELELEKMHYARLSYIILLNYCENHNKNLIQNLDIPEFYNKTNYLHLGNNAARQLNVFLNNKTQINNKFDSLQSVINFTQTPMGKRLLKFNLGNPIFNSEILNNRYSLINNIINKNSYDNLKIILHDIIDIERIHRKMSLGTLHPFDFFNLNESYKLIIKLYENIKTTKLQDILTHELYSQLLDFMTYYNSIFDINNMDKYNINDITGSFYKKNIHSEIDNLQNKISSNKFLLEKIRDKMELYINDKKKDFFNSNSNKKVNMIQIQFNTVNKYYFLITSRRCSQLKINLKKEIQFQIDDITIRYDDFDFKSQSKSSTTKIVSNLLDKTSDKIIINSELLKTKMKNLYVNDLSEIYNKYKIFFAKLSKAIANIDFLNSGALCATKYKYSQPTIIDNPISFVSVKGMRHPIIERIIDSPYITHDLDIGIKSHNGILLYGLNSAGKSSLMKSIGLNIILAQIGYFVSCKEFTFNPYQSLFTRIESTDNIFKGLSSFALELIELKSILKRSGENTLVLADEVCKGTEHNSALVIVMTMIKMLINSKTSFISATHLHELTKLDIIKDLKNLKVYHLDILYENDNIIYNRLLKEGNGTEEYGLDFAKFIISDSKFKTISNEIKNIVNNKTNYFNNNTSRYNSKIVMEKCDICDSQNNLETHHIEFQKNCDKHGFILNPNKNHIHKNHESNLVVLCDKCHDKIHNNLIIIEGYQETAKENVLKYSIINKNKNNNKNKKYDKNIIDYILEKKDLSNITQKKVKSLIENKFNKKISTSTISKIWNGKYI